MIQINLIPADTIYMIRHTKIHDPIFFLYDTLEVPPHIDADVAIWTPNQQKAREFYSEETVETFLYQNLRNRPCEIICVKLV